MAIIKYVPIVCGVTLIVGAFILRPREGFGSVWRFVYLGPGILRLYFAVHRIIRYPN
ncbi:MAG: hypothetical protein WA209_04695 [Candidatus Acidiferrales bacterium]